MLASDDSHSKSPEHYLDEFHLRGPRQVCQYQFRKNDIVWICKNCQQDDTCVQCNECYEAANHKGHEVFFYHSQAGGCCDCGDSSSWKIDGCCNKHGKVLENPLVHVPQSVTTIGAVMMKTLVSRIVRFCNRYKEAYNGHTPSGSQLASGDSTWHLVLHNDDINSFDNVIEALDHLGIGISECRNIAMIVHKEGSKMLRSGHFHELFFVMSVMQDANLKVALLPDDLYSEKDSILVCLSWMLDLARVNDGFCHLVSAAFPIDDLVSLLRTDNYLSKDIVSSIHNLYLALMANISFKTEIAKAYSIAISDIAKNYGNGIGPQETSAFSLSVQFLNRPTIVNELVQNYGYLTSLCNSITSMLDMPNGEMNHYVLTNRRYNPLLGDLKIMFSIPGVSRLFCGSELSKWILILSKYQFMHEQERETRYHVEFENREWVNAFNFYLGMSSMFDHLVSWFEDPSSSISEVLTAVDSRLTVMLPSVYDVLVSMKNAVISWQADSWLVHDDFSLYACFPKGAIELREYPRKLSFHILLHRFLANSIRECCKSCALVETLERFQADILSDYDNTKHFPDPSLLAISRASQIKAGIWRRNGQVYTRYILPRYMLIRLISRANQAMMDQFVNYADVPLCRSYRDLDILFIQVLLFRT